MNTKESLKQEWNQITNQIISIETSIDNTVSPLEIIPLAKKIRVLDRNLQYITIKTLNSLLFTDEINPFLCKSCHIKMNILDGDIICENPICKLNAYE